MIEIIRGCIHYSLHFIVPIIIALFFYKENWKWVSVVLLLTMLVDIDHLWATPIFDAHRCSIGFHFFHSYAAIGVYAIMFFIPKCRIISIGLLLHMATDYQDCLWI